MAEFDMILDDINPEDIDLPVVIIGAGHAGVQVAAGLRTRGWTGGIVLVDEEGGLPYERPPLSKDVLGPDETAEGGPLLRKDAFYASKDITRLAGVRVGSIDRGRRVVALDDGQELAYHRLVIASGARGRRLTVPGHDLSGVLSLRTAADALAVRGELVPGARVVIIGAGYIGMEVAAAATKRGCDVTVLEFQDRVMKRVTSEPVSEFYQQLHRSKGVRFAFGAAVSAIEGEGRVERVLTADGRSYPADVVVAGIGVIPNQELAEAAGIACRDGILVDEACRTSDPAVYAAGDVTRFISTFGGAEMRLECLQNAQQQADVVADTIMGRTPREAEVPWFWTVQFDVRLQTAGVMHPDDDIVLRGDPATGKFSVCYLREDSLAAIDTVGSLADFRQGKKLIAAGTFMDRTALADPAVRLEDCVLETAKIAA
ncbi:3-phenylpropionate/trans-cinnamate dioxygenase ferredoxin reductase subunit [Raineyella antarctica]|uniref:3-phenylpropionate/trans-cinnamate dioxygenase ferredoxin reductase subunit n=1 Tax=Raineyella antarctica TaxID=1577474 RepID=A0A1G6GCS3_9ACTN|nr:FAD-dependent oxidoreductase [Raineyella antarctica]SDB79802.1 3-phenylpropionate/trans-cinnamate dioxygenase ferredoxin reductase subunit [Raineyella antarctica]